MYRLFLYLSPMKKIILIVVLGLSLLSCEKDCGCDYVAKKEIRQKQISQTFWIDAYYVKFRNECGSTHEDEVNQTRYNSLDVGEVVCYN